MEEEQCSMHKVGLISVGSEQKSLQLQHVHPFIPLIPYDPTNHVTSQ